MGVGRSGWPWRPLGRVLIPYSSGMGVGPRQRPPGVGDPRLNTLFVRYECGTPLLRRLMRSCGVLIPYSSGMGVGQLGIREPMPLDRLNTLFVRYGCGTEEMDGARPSILS